MEEEPLTLEEAGKKLGVTKERVRQLQNKALHLLRARIDEDDDCRDFLLEK